MDPLLCVLGLSPRFLEAEDFLDFTIAPFLAGSLEWPYFLRPDFGLELAVANFSYLESSSGLFRMDWTFLKIEILSYIFIFGNLKSQEMIT